MVSYDPAVIKTFAQNLYDRATTVVAVHTFIGLILGGTVGKFAFGDTGMLILAAVAGAIGFVLGSQKAFILKLQAQTALCQVEIEQNTRGANIHFAANSPDVVAKIAAPSGAPTSTVADESSKVGVCPGCDTTIPLASSSCPKCGAIFGEDSAWAVRPL